MIIDFSQLPASLTYANGGADDSPRPDGGSYHVNQPADSTRDTSLSKVRATYPIVIILVA